jgi:speckle-type POZ protein
MDDYLTIECTVTVVKGSHVSDSPAEYEIEVPPSDLSDHFGKLLLEEEGADVTFSVGGEAFAAHKVVLAARSPVFRAELYGQMKERTAPSITLEDMQPSAFRALLHFVYTDSLPDMDDLDHDEYSEIIRHLLVAADRYAMDRLKLMCQNILCQYIDADSVAETLALADRHNCDGLKDVCIDFMATSDEMDAVVATQGFANLKRTCPSVLVDVLEKRSKFCKA